MSDVRLSLNQAALAGVTLLRDPKWADPLAHLKIYIHEGKLGPWVKLFDPFNQECNGKDPVEMLTIKGVSMIDPDEMSLVPYTGPTADSDEYRNRAASFKGVLS
jgi:hypothetical protein